MLLTWNRVPIWKLAMNPGVHAAYSIRTWHGDQSPRQIA
jgi:hypothetical protein